MRPFSGKEIKREEKVTSSDETKDTDVFLSRREAKTSLTKVPENGSPLVGVAETYGPLPYPTQTGSVVRQVITDGTRDCHD